MRGQSSHITNPLSALNGNLGWTSFQHTVEFLLKRWKSQLPNFFQVTDINLLLEESQGDRQQLGKNNDRLNDSPDLRESPELLTQEIARWEQRVQEKTEEKERLELSNAQMQQAMRDNLSQLKSLVQTMLKMIHLA